jgi:hypothetical protein
VYSLDTSHTHSAEEGEPVKEAQRRKLQEERNQKCSVSVGAARPLKRMKTSNCITHYRMYENS